MNPTNYLYAAYIATGLIHLGYVGTLISRYLRVCNKMRDLNKQA